MGLDELRQRCGKEWPSIAKAKRESVARIDQLRTIVQGGAGGQSIDSEDISVVTFGSLAREEWTGGSDLDWTLLIDGEADHQHTNTATQFRTEIEKGFAGAGTTGVFGTLTFSHDLIHLIGGPDDTNRNTTRRMLLLLESKPVNADGAYNRVTGGILNRYLENDFRSFRLKVPRFLLNDLNRFWRTLCVDYANKYRARAGVGWATRILKLRMSRKLVFASGLLTCFNCDPRIVALINPRLVEKPSAAAQVEYLRLFVRQPPLEVLAAALSRLNNCETAGLILDNYDRFLGILDDPEKRKRLDELPPPDGEERDEIFRDMICCSRDLEQGLLRLFYDDPLLAVLLRDYGIF